ncbi:alpha/beta hydrolase [Algoriphagus sp. C2-6-M1]|uniref:alpha/beta fold hydrolase n=1 Tax=Algoriphagus persicinus TaxID=3108754 RepID=UPI002B3B5EB5|nr:alpha/beta hydrolase [Algoriphagus sp. C2-6-M1]MEB2782663.1 alpha/beta hydrolase [Algoriphagus sp. C2-6-M1]
MKSKGGNTMNEKAKRKTAMNTEPTNQAPEVGARSAIPEPTVTVIVTENDELNVWVLGEGKPVVLIHGALFYYLLKPVAEALAEKGYQAIWYHRRGYNGESTGSYQVDEQGQDIVKILDELEISKAHVVGHSAGVPYALSVALNAPDRVSSAALLDFMFAKFIQAPPPGGDPSQSPQAKAQAGDWEGAATAFLAAFNYDKAAADKAQPGSWDVMVKDAPTWFTVELPVLMSYLPDQEKVSETKVPLAFLVVGDVPPIRETGNLLKKWQPNLTMLEISTTDHFFPVTDPAATAEVIDDWIKSLSEL